MVGHLAIWPLEEIGGLGSQTFGLFFYKLEDLKKQKG